jgi:hypothetical protein
VLLSVETAPSLKASSVRKQDHLPVMDTLAATNEDAILSARQTLIRQIVNKQVSDGSWGDRWMNVFRWAARSKISPFSPGWLCCNPAITRQS